MAHWIGAQGQVKLAKKTQKHLHLWRPPQWTPNPKRKTFFSKWTRRLAESVEDLNNSLALSVGKLWLNKVSTTIVALRSLMRFRELLMRKIIWMSNEWNVAHFFELFIQV